MSVLGSNSNGRRMSPRVNTDSCVTTTFRTMIADSISTDAQNQKLRLNLSDWITVTARSSFEIEGQEIDPTPCVRGVREHFRRPIETNTQTQIPNINRYTTLKTMDLSCVIWLQELHESCHLSEDVCRWTSWELHGYVYFGRLCRELRPTCWRMWRDANWGVSETVDRRWRFEAEFWTSRTCHLCERWGNVYHDGRTSSRHVHFPVCPSINRTWTFFSSCNRSVRCTTISDSKLVVWTRDRALRMVIVIRVL